jgi:hypothetical protein
VLKYHTYEDQLDNLFAKKGSPSPAPAAAAAADNKPAAEKK